MKKYLYLGIAGVILYVTNPTQADFDLFVKETVQNRMAGKDEFTKIFAGGFISGFIKEGTYRKDYFLFSKYTVDTTMVGLFQKELPPKIEVVGVAGQFIPLTKF